MKDPNAIRKALEDAHHRDELIPHLASLDDCRRSMEYGPVLAGLHNSGKVCLCSDDTLAAIEALSRKEFWSIIHPFYQAIPEIDCSYRDVLRLVQTLVSKAGSDGASGMPNLALVKWCKRNPEQAQLIINRAKDLDPTCLSSCVYSIQGLENTDCAFELLEHSDERVVTAGLLSLGTLKIADEGSAKRVIDACYEAVKVYEGQETRDSAIQTAFNTWKKLSSLEPYRQREFIKAIIDSPDGYDLVQLAAAIFYDLDGLAEENIALILDGLSAESPDPLPILRCLDDALHSERIKKYFSEVSYLFAVHIPRIKEPVEPNQFYNFSQMTWDDRKKAAQLFSRWLTTGGFSLCNFIAEMVKESGEKHPIVRIPRDLLPKDAGDQRFMARKCVGFLWFNEVTAASILLSIINNGRKAARGEAEALLYDPLLLCYSGDLREYIENENKYSRSKRIRESTDRLIQQHDVYLEGLKKAQHLVEFTPPIEQQRTVAMRDRERNKSIQKQAHERSVLYNLMTHQTLLYGNKTFSVIREQSGKKVPKIMPLSEFSYSVEFPRLSVIDPVGFQEQLMAFKLEKGSDE